MSIHTEPHPLASERDTFAEQLRIRELVRGLRSVQERYNFLPASEYEVEVVKAIDRHGSTLRYLDYVEKIAYRKNKSNQAGNTAVQRAVNAFQARYDSAIGGIDHAQELLRLLNGVKGSFDYAFPVEYWPADSDLRSALVDLSWFAELSDLADKGEGLERNEMPMPYSGMTTDEVTEKVTDTLGVMTANGLRSTARQLGGSEHIRMQYWGQRLLEANDHAYGRTHTTEELGLIAAQLLLTK